MRDPGALGDLSGPPQARTKHAATRARVAKARLKRITTRLAKLERRVDGWAKEIGKPYRGLSGRLRSLRNKTTAVRNSTMRRRYGSLIADVQRKIDQREEWIAAAERERKKLELEREANLATIAESARLLERRKCDKSETP